jgi:signal transduction histidine kinase
MLALDAIRRPPAVRCGVAALLAIAAGLLRVSLTGFFHDRNELLMFYPAMMFAAWFGGLWAGIVSTLTSAVMDAYMFLEPVGTFRLTHHSDKIALAIFVATGVVISLLNENLHRNAVREQSAREDAERARIKADTANRTKDFFLAAVSHDLRAPMTAALGWCEILGRESLDESQRQRAIMAIRRSVDRQLVLVSDLLDTAAIVSGKLRVERKTLDVSRVVRSAVEVVEPIADAKRLDIRVENASKAGRVIGDAQRLQQVMVNLLSNAVKFTPQGGSVRVWVGDVGNAAEVRVTDNGRGLSESELAHVFEAFWQADRRSEPNSWRGVGLGLSIAQQLVRAHGGTIEAMSAGAGQGCTFTLRLPLAIATSATPSLRACV